MNLKRPLAIVAALAAIILGGLAAMGSAANGDDRGPCPAGHYVSWYEDIFPPTASVWVPNFPIRYVVGFFPGGGSQTIGDGSTMNETTITFGAPVERVAWCKRSDRPQPTTTVPPTTLGTTTTTAPATTLAPTTTTTTTEVEPSTTTTTTTTIAPTTSSTTSTTTAPTTTTTIAMTTTTIAQTTTTITPTSTTSTTTTIAPTTIAPTTSTTTTAAPPTTPPDSTTPPTTAGPTTTAASPTTAPSSTTSDPTTSEPGGTSTTSPTASTTASTVADPDDDTTTTRKVCRDADGNEVDCLPRTGSDGHQRILVIAVALIVAGASLLFARRGRPA